MVDVARVLLAVLAVVFVVDVLGIILDFFGAEVFELLDVEIVIVQVLVVGFRVVKLANLTINMLSYLRPLLNPLLLLLVVGLDGLLTEQGAVLGFGGVLRLVLALVELVPVDVFDLLVEGLLPSPKLNSPEPGSLNVKLSGLRVVIHQLDQFVSGEAEAEEDFAGDVFVDDLALQVEQDLVIAEVGKGGQDEELLHGLHLVGIQPQTQTDVALLDH